MQELKKTSEMKRVTSLIVQITLFVLSIAGFSSCASNDYTKAIPTNSTAIMAFDIESMKQMGGNDITQSLASLLNINNISKCGLDLSQKIYMFETNDGNFGTCIKVSDNDDIEQCLKTLNEKGKCSKTTKKRDFTFALLHDSWEIGFSEEAFIMLGPILPVQQADAIRNIRKYLKQAADGKDKESPLIEKLDSIEGAMALVAQIDALPDKITAPFTLVQPNETDCSQIIIAASMDKSSDNNLAIQGSLFSFNNDVDKGIKENLSKLREIEGKYALNIPNNSLCTIFLNAEGNDLVNMTHNSKQLGGILAGINTAIDMDNILRCTSGDFTLSIDSYSEAKANMSMAAKLTSRKFLNDVDYWKKSCPSGSKIEDYGKDSFMLQTSDISFWFGATETNDFFGSTDKARATGILKPCDNPYPKDIINEIKGKKMCMVLNISQILKQIQDTSETKDFIAPLFGKVKNIIFSIK